MMRKWTIAAALLVACSMTASTAFAGPGDKCEKKAKCSKTCAKTCDTKSACCPSGAFPAMDITVGDKTTHCPMEAKKIAAESHAKIVYAVGKDKYEDQAKAMAALADASEAYLADYMTIKCRVDGKLISCGDCSSKCGTAKASCGGKAGKSACGGDAKKASLASGSGCGSKGGEKVADKDGSCASKKGAEGAMATCDPSKCKDKCSEFVVMGHTYKSWDEAAKARKDALAAAEAVKVEYIVDGNKVDCASHVCPKAKAAGKVKYVVNGEETDCDTSFRVMVAKAKYDAANNTLAPETKTAKM